MPTRQARGLPANGELASIDTEGEFRSAFLKVFTPALIHPCVRLLSRGHWLSRWHPPNEALQFRRVVEVRVDLFNKPKGVGHVSATLLEPFQQQIEPLLRCGPFIEFRLMPGERSHQV